MTTTLHVMRLSARKLRRLTVRDRYVYALTGHVFNEIMALQKLVLSCFPSGATLHAFELEASVGTTSMLLKILGSKLTEAHDSLSRPAVVRVLEQSYFAAGTGERERWTRVRQEVAGNPWLRNIRRSAAFHYMRESQWAPVLTDDTLDDAHILIGRNHHATFYPWADAVATEAVLVEVNPIDRVAGLQTWVNSLQSLAVETCACLADGLAHISVNYLLEDGPDAMGAVEVFDAPRIETFHAPYFFSDTPPEAP